MEMMKNIERKIIVIEHDGKWIGMIVDMVTEVNTPWFYKDRSYTGNLSQALIKRTLEELVNFQKDRLLINTWYWKDNRRNWDSLLRIKSRKEDVNGEYKEAYLSTRVLMYGFILIYDFCTV